MKESLNKWIPQCVNCSNPESQGEDSLRISSAKILRKDLAVEFDILTWKLITPAI